MDGFGKIVKGLGKLILPVAILSLILVFGIIYYIDSVISETATAITERLNFSADKIWPIKFILFSFTAFVTGLTLYYPFSKESRRKWVKVVYPFVGFSLIVFAVIGYNEKYDKENLLGSCVYRPRDGDSKPYHRKKNNGDCIVVTETNLHAMQAYLQGVKPQYWDLSTVKDIDQIQWFDGPNALFFYNLEALKQRGELRVFKGAGYDRLDGTVLEPLNFEIINKHIKPKVSAYLELEEKKQADAKALKLLQDEAERKQLAVEAAKAAKLAEAEAAKAKALEAKAKAEEAKAEVERQRIAAEQRALELRTQKEAQEREAQRNRDTELEKLRIAANRDAELRAEESRRNAERVAREKVQREEQATLQADTQKVKDEVAKRILAKTKTWTMQNVPTVLSGIKIEAGEEVLSWEGSAEFKVNGRYVNYTRKIFRDYPGQVIVLGARGNFNPVNLKISPQPEIIIEEVKSALNLPHVNIEVKLD